MIFNRLIEYFNSDDDEVDGDSLQRDVGVFYAGVLRIPSRTIGIGSLEVVEGVQEIGELASDEITVFTVNRAGVYDYDKNHVYQAGLILQASGDNGVLAKDCDWAVTRRELVSVCHRLAVADAVDFRSHWTEVGLKRTGRISIARGHRYRKLIEKKFGVRTRFAPPVTAEIVGDVSEELERKILQFVASFPEHADFPQMVFHVQTWNTFDKINFLSGDWDFLPIGNASEPIMFVCDAIGGMGYRMIDIYSHNGQVQKIEIDFMVPCGE